jgi:hypothetical protein
VYIHNLNITYVRNIDIDRIDVRNERYKNRSVPGAITVVPRQAFVRAQRVDRAAVTVRQAELGRAPVQGMDPSLAPERESILGRPLEAGRAAPRPPEAVRNRRVGGTKADPPTYGGEPARPPVRILPVPDREEQTVAPAEQRRAAEERQKRAAVEERMRREAEEQRRAVIEQQRRAPAEEPGQATVEDQRRGGRERSRGPAVQPETGRREKQPRSNAPIQKKRKLIKGPNGWVWVWVEEGDNGGN